MAYVVVREPGRVAFSVTLPASFRVGRDEKSDLAVADRAVSRHHAELAAAGDGYQLTDLGSTHGTFVNGERVSLRALREGDEIQVGNVALTYRADDVSPAAPSGQTTVETPGAPGAESPRLRLFYEVSRAIGALSEPDELLGRMLEAILDTLSCERGLVGLTEGGRGSPRRVARTRGGGGAEEIVVSRTLLEAMVERRQCVMVRSARAADAPGTMQRQGIRCAMGVPLETPSCRWGFLYVDDRGAEDRFSQADLDFLLALARLTAAALESAERYAEVQTAAEALQRRAAADQLIGESGPMKRLRSVLARYAPAQASVLVRGESGTGKELAARALHDLSPRAEQPFVAINCSAIPDTMIESELFGHERGAFTGAAKSRRGAFVLAHRGTLFLDEIGDLSPAAQAKLLRAVEEGEVQPLGSERTFAVDLRIVSATHKDLLAEIAAGRFREDLYYRLAVVEVLVPALRDRGEDIAALARVFLDRARLRLGRRLVGFSDDALAALARFPWPGNVRQLANEIERAAIHADGPTVLLGDLSARISGVAAPATSAPASLAERYAGLEPTERGLVDEALREARGNFAEAARLLGITRIMLKRRAIRFGLVAGEADEPAE